MYLVALAELAGTVEAEAAALAVDLGLGVYEARLLLSGERPKIVLRTAEQERARSLLASLRARRHGAVAFDGRAVVATDAMVDAGRFTLGADGLHTPSGDHLPWDDLLAVLRAVRTRSTTTTEVVKERKLAVGTAIASGGLMLTKKSTREVVKRTEDREQIMILVRRSGERAFILREHSAHFDGLGPDKAPSVVENLNKLASVLASRAPLAVFDDRLLHFRVADDAAASERLDEQVHALALCIARLGRGPYR